MVSFSTACIGSLLLAGLASISAHTPYDDIQMFCLVNQYRQTQGKPPFSYDPRLKGAAQGHSDYQHQIKTMTHDGDSPANSMDKRITQAGVGWNLCAENVAQGDLSVPDVLNVWIKSPGHRDNLLSDNELYGGASTGDGFYTYYTQDFARCNSGDKAKNASPPDCSRYGKPTTDFPQVDESGVPIPRQGGGGGYQPPPSTQSLSPSPQYGGSGDYQPPPPQYGGNGDYQPPPHNMGVVEVINHHRHRSMEVAEVINHHRHRSMEVAEVINHHHRNKLPPP